MKAILILIALLPVLGAAGGSTGDTRISRVYRAYGERRYILRPAAGQYVVIAGVTRKDDEVIDANAKNNFELGAAERIEVEFPITDPEDKKIDEIRTYLKKSSPKVHAALEERLAILKKRAAEK